MFTRDFLTPLFDELFQELDQVVSKAGRQFREDAQTRPCVNVTATDDTVVVTASLPGIDADSIDVKVQDERLTISGRSEAAATGKPVANERSAGAFSRTIRLPFAVDARDAEAQYRNGILILTLKARPEAGPIQVKVTKG